MAIGKVLDPTATRDADITSPGPDALVLCCGGTGGLHATGFHSFGSCLTQTRAIVPGPEKSQ